MVTGIGTMAANTELQRLLTLLTSDFHIIAAIVMNSDYQAHQMPFQI